MDKGSFIQNLQRNFAADVVTCFLTYDHTGCLTSCLGGIPDRYGEKKWQPLD
jgi:hypothetical protein